MPNQPGNAYWQAPNWSGQNMPPAYYPARLPPPNYNNYRPPIYRPMPPSNYPTQNGYQQAPRQTPNNYSNNTPPPPAGPYRSTNQGPDNGASAYNMPGYHRYRNNNGWNNMWGNNNNDNLWGNSGPGKWMNPNKRNMEQGWDDMINAPSRVGEMPGGWTAPEVSMPNPIDVGDQFQDNVKDLPEQIRDMNVGNN